MQISEKSSLNFYSPLRSALHEDDTSAGAHRLRSYGPSPLAFAIDSLIDKHKLLAMLLCLLVMARVEDERRAGPGPGSDV